MLPFAIVLLCVSAVPKQTIHVALDPATGTLAGSSVIAPDGNPGCFLQLPPNTNITALQPAGFDTAAAIPADQTVRVKWEGVYRDDIASGEQAGQIHNFSVDAHIGEDGIFLSDNAPWFPQLVDGEGQPVLRLIDLSMDPLEGWTCVGSGDPTCNAPMEIPCLSWATPRPVEGVALVGNAYDAEGRIVHTPAGPVEVVAVLSPKHFDKVGFYLDAAESYLDLYTPLLGAYPYRRFTIVENFFSSGFAFPGFTVLGPRVVGMAPRSLAPGYLDHELLHAWWGNGVYVDAQDGNWCEALTSYCTNYGRRVLEEGAEAGRAYRRGLLNKVSLDPTLDNGALGDFGSADPSGGGPDRFVGYDKGAFVFMMLEDVLNNGEVSDASQSAIWPVLARFASDNMGRRANWAAMQAAAESQRPDMEKGWLDDFFRTWVREHTVPLTSGDRDPDYRLYRLLPPWQISPTIAGTLQGASVYADDAAGDSGDWLADVDHGDNLLLIGPETVAEHARLLERCDDPIAFHDGGFSVGGVNYAGEDLAVLHTMGHPDDPGRFITLFCPLGEGGWERLRLIWYYGKDTTVIWDANQTLLRRVYEPAAKIEQ